MGDQTHEDHEARHRMEVADGCAPQSETVSKQPSRTFFCLDRPRRCLELGFWQSPARAGLGGALGQPGGRQRGRLEFNNAHLSIGHGATRRCWAHGALGPRSGKGRWASREQTACDRHGVRRFASRSMRANVSGRVLVRPAASPCAMFPAGSARKGRYRRAGRGNTGMAPRGEGGGSLAA